jgi:hypothetical protein
MYSKIGLRHHIITLMKKIQIVNTRFIFFDFPIIALTDIIKEEKK